jgi:hypothetical protein
MNGRMKHAKALLRTESISGKTATVLQYLPQLWHANHNAIRSYLPT